MQPGLCKFMPKIAGYVCFFVSLLIPKVYCFQVLNFCFSTELARISLIQFLFFVSCFMAKQILLLDTVNNFNLAKIEQGFMQNMKLDNDHQNNYPNNSNSDRNFYFYHLDNRSFYRAHTCYSSNLNILLVTDKIISQNYDPKILTPDFTQKLNQLVQVNSKKLDKRILENYEINGSKFRNLDFTQSTENNSNYLTVKKQQKLLKKISEKSTSTDSGHNSAGTALDICSNLSNLDLKSQQEKIESYTTKLENATIFHLDLSKMEDLIFNLNMDTRYKS